MTDEVMRGAEAPVNELRATLESAFLADSGDSESAPQPTGGRERDDQGRFAKSGEPPDPRLPGDATATTTESPIPAGPDVQPSQEPSAVPKAAPPPGWSSRSKADFDALPAHVREDIARREVEISNGFAKLADYKGLDAYVEMARSAGSSLPEALERYVAAENLLGQDFSNGILSLCQMYNVDPAQLGQFLTGQRGDHPRAGGDQPEDQAFAPVLNRLNSVDQRLQQWERQMAERETESIQSELARFAADPKNRYFDNVRQAMGQIIVMNPEASLSEAYDQACWMNPEIRQLLIKQQQEAETAKSRAAADQARRASGSLPNGSPVPGAISTTGPAPSLRAELERAFEAARI